MKHIAVLLSVFGLVSCQTVVEIDLPDRDSQLTINCLFGTDSAMVIMVDASKGILEPGNIESIPNATLSVSGSDGTSEQITGYTDRNIFTEKYEYRLNLVPKTGVVYSIATVAPGFESVSAKTSVPDRVAIIGIDTASIVTDGYREGQLSVSFQDPSGMENFYELKFYLLSYFPDTTGGQFRWVASTYPVYAYSNNDDFFSGGGSEQLIFTDELFDGRQYTARVNYAQDYQFYDSSSVEFYLSAYLITELRSLSSDYFKFQTTYNTYLYSSGDPFAQPAQVYNNVDKGFGIFAGFNAARDTLRVREGAIPSPID